jgi:hypothetical protein
MSYPDKDGDGFGDQANPFVGCGAPAGFIATSGDCQDDDAEIHPGATEICDQADNNCDELVDDADAAVDTSTGTLYYRDADGDGFGDASMTAQSCALPSGYAASSTDCNDAESGVHPDALEVCDDNDNDCDALVDIDDPSLDPASTQSYYQDGDGDGFGSGSAVVACAPPPDHAQASGDCDDANSAAHPGGVEVCDGADNDCDGGNDGTAAAPNQCAGLVGTYAGSYSHETTEKIGGSIINQMKCTGTGSAELAFSNTPALQGTFTCVYNGGLSIFSKNQVVTISASVGLDGKVTGTVDHVYNTSDDLHRVYNVAGTQTATDLTLSGTGSWFPHPMSVQPWEVKFSFAATR